MKKMESLPPRGAWIEISRSQGLGHPRLSRSPHGERGLKFHALEYTMDWEESLPPRGAWIEIAKIRLTVSASGGSLPPRGAWIEIQRSVAGERSKQSRSPHGERGLKLLVRCGAITRLRVAPPTGSVD